MVTADIIVFVISLYQPTISVSVIKKIELAIMCRAFFLNCGQQIQQPRYFGMITL